MSGANIHDRSPFLSVRYTGVDPRILVLDNNYVKSVHRVDRHESVSKLVGAVQELYHLDLGTGAADEL